MNRKEIKKILDSVGVKECPPDHPIYTSGWTIRCVNRSGVSGIYQHKNDSPMDELHKKGVEKAIDAINRFIEDPDSFDLDWDYERRSALERLERQRAGLPAEPTAALLQFPKKQLRSDRYCHSENDISVGDDNE
ncbi:hypothetical protein OAL10_02325 [Gammaproteobacteria bacterium]|nr:hypothetical protein [Gammaproteobacteria bacterium]